MIDFKYMCRDPYLCIVNVACRLGKPLGIQGLSLPAAQYSPGPFTIWASVSLLTNSPGDWIKCYVRKDPSEFSVDLWMHYRGTWVVSDFLQGLGADPHILRKAGSGESVPSLIGSKHLI